MKILSFISSLVILIGFQLAGESLKRWLHSPLPAPLFGIALFFVFLCASPVKPSRLLETGNTMLRYLPLFFIPPGVALLAYGQILSLHGVAIITVLCVSTVLTMVLTIQILKRIEPEDLPNASGDSKKGHADEC